MTDQNISSVHWCLLLPFVVNYHNATEYCKLIGARFPTSEEYIKLTQNESLREGIINNWGWVSDSFPVMRYFGEDYTSIPLDLLSSQHLAKLVPIPLSTADSLVDAN